MNLNLSLKEFQKAIGAKILKGSGYIIKSFSTDTRKIKKGDVFWALKGATFDGNNFIKQAIDTGVSGIICRKNAFPKEYLDKLDFVIETEDTLIALHRLASYLIKKSGMKVVSVTGSNGKTTTKEMIKHILSARGPVCSNFGNFNNQFGLPLSVLELEKKHKFAVFELGASKRGDVAELAEIIRPDISVITTIGPEHLEFFGSMENIFKTETETLDFLKKSGSVIFNGDNEWLRKLKKKKIRQFSFGFDKDNKLVISKEGEKYFFLFKGKKYSIKLAMMGSHNMLNAAAAFLAATELGIKPVEAISQLSSFKGVKMRMQKFKYKGNVIIFDAYNSNPQSLEAFLKETSNIEPQILVLGDMKELGKFSAKYHKESAQNLMNRKAKVIILIGPHMKVAFDFLNKNKENVKYFYETSQAKDLIDRLFRISKNSFFLFKASRSMRLENLLPETVVKNFKL